MSGFTLIQVQSVDKAFRDGVLEMSTEPSGVPLVDAGNASSSVTVLLIGISFLLILINFPRIVGIMPSILRGFVFRRDAMKIGRSSKSVSDRNAMALSLFIPFCLLVGGTGIFNPSFLGNIPGHWMAPLFAVFLAAAFLLRLLFTSIANPAGMKSDEWDAAKGSIVNSFCVAVPAMLLAAGIMAVFGVEKDGMKLVLSIVMAIALAVDIISTSGFLHEGCSLIRTFLYLCALEIIPVGALAAVAILL